MPENLKFYFCCKTFNQSLKVESVHLKLYPSESSTLLKLCIKLYTFNSFYRLRLLDHFVKSSHWSGKR